MARDPAAANRAEPIARLHVFMRLPSNGAGVSYTCASIAKALDPTALGVTIFTPYTKAGVAGSVRVVETLPIPLRFLPSRFRLPVWTRFTEQSLYAETKKAADEGVIVHVWPDLTLRVLRRLRELGVPIVREMVNCHLGTAKTILDAEYRRLGLTRAIPSASVEAEREALDLCDYVFCSNSHSQQSLIDNGVPAHKIRMAGFGWDPDRFRGDSRALERVDGTTFLFLGYICVRKGAHLLLQYWVKSGIKGRLVLVGNIEPAIASAYGEYLRRPDVKVMKYTRDIGSIYRSADVFVFPSLEEGGPQVTSEAAGCGLPLITSPMGAALTAVHGLTGFVVDPLDESGWIEAMRTLARDPDLRRRAGSSAFQRAQRVTWEKVAAAREAVFREIAEERFGRRLAPRKHEPPRASFAERDRADVDADLSAKFTGERGAAASSRT
jgi:glycosyltransferase involved in cell wall biosynthesis